MSYCHFFSVRYVGDHPNDRTLIFPRNSISFLNFPLSCCSHMSTGMFIIFIIVLTSRKKLFVSFKNRCRWRGIITNRIWRKNLNDIEKRNEKGGVVLDGSRTTNSNTNLPRRFCMVVNVLSCHPRILKEIRILQCLITMYCVLFRIVTNIQPTGVPIIWIILTCEKYWARKTLP